MTDLFPEQEPEAEPEPARPASRVGLVLATVVLLVAGVGAATYISSGGGADSPEDAVAALATAISDEDLLGVLDALAPTERDVLRDTVEGVTKELRRLDVLDDDVDLSGIDGVDVELRDLAMTSRRLGDGVTLVTVRGNAKYAVDPSELPAGGFLDEMMEGEDASAESGSESIDDLELVTIEDGGRWYVSVFYSIADAIRRDAELPAPAFGDGLEPEGASSPDGALRELIDAGVDLDIRRAIALIDPEEGRVLHDYAPLFIDDAEAAAEEARDSFDVEIHQLETDVDRDGGRATVAITHLDATARSDEGTIAVEFDGECLAITVDGDTESSCDAESAEPLGIPLFGSLFSGISAPGGDGGEMQPIEFVMVERRGEWYLSPLRTVLEPMVESLRRVERSDLDTLDQLFSGFAGAAEAGEMIQLDEVDRADLSDRGVQSNLRNAFVAFMVSLTDTGAWPTDPSVLADIEPSVIFFPYSSFSIPPQVVSFEVDGDVVRLASQGEQGCFYMEGRTDGSVAYASDPSCGPPAAQTYQPSW